MFSQLLFITLNYLVIAEGRFFRNDYKYHENIGGWLKLHRVPSNWNDARLRCHFEGAVLVSPLNNEVLRAMQDVAAANKLSCIFTGVSAIYSKGDFFSIEGISIEKLPVSWAPGEPDNYEDNEMCTILKSNGTLADVDCSEPHPYICFKGNNEDIPSPSQCGTVDPEYVFEQATGHCYKFHPIGQTWSRAFLTCAAEGGHLAIINSDKEAEILKNIFAKYPSNKILSKFREGALIGFRAENNTYDWLTVHGQTLKEAGYDKWSPGQPDNMLGTQFCGAIFRNALLDDTSCNVPIPFICEKTPGSLLDNNSDTTEETAQIGHRID